MALRVTMKPGEQLFVGTGSIAVASNQIATIIVDGDMPVLRERDYLRPELASTKARDIYLSIQQVYLTGSFDSFGAGYFAQVQTLLSESPGATPFVKEINAALTDKHLYNALKAARRLVQFDEGAIDSIELTVSWRGFEPEAQH
jgi:flagellar biosynthesis repressor protein FlbT